MFPSGGYCNAPQNEVGRTRSFTCVLMEYGCPESCLKEFRESTSRYVLDSMLKRCFLNDGLRRRHVPSQGDKACSTLAKLLPHDHGPLHGQWS